MLVKFNSKAGTFSMFGDVAEPLLKAMGQSGAIPGAILAADIPAALARLRQAVAQDGPDPHEKREEAEEAEERGDALTLAKRAFPLIELLGNAAAQDADVTWDVDRPLFR